jgi:hypothetical protein
MNQLGRYRVDCIVCGGMGRRAIEALGAEGVKVYMADGKTVLETVEKMKSSGLAEIDPAKACRGHGQQPGGCAHGPFTADDVRAQPGRGAGFGLGAGRDSGFTQAGGFGQGSGPGQGGGRGQGSGRGQGGGRKRRN